MFYGQREETVEGCYMIFWSNAKDLLAMQAGVSITFESSERKLEKTVVRKLERVLER